MIHIKCVVPECYIDTCLVQLLLEENHRPNHQHGKGDVLNTLHLELKNDIAFGVIDEDKNKGAKPTLLDNYIEPQRDEANGLEIRRHDSNSHHLVIICPEIEKWLMAACEEANFNPTDFDLPAELKGLKEVTKAKNIEEHKGFRKLISALEQKNSSRIICLKKWLEKLSHKN